MEYASSATRSYAKKGRSKPIAIDLIPDYLYAFILPLAMVLVGVIGFVAWWWYHQAVRDWWADVVIPKLAGWRDGFFDFVCRKAFGDESIDKPSNEEWG